MRGKIQKGRERRCAPGPCHFNKEQTPLAIFRCQPADSRRLLGVFGAHLQGSPLNCKFVLRLSTHPAPAPGNTLPVADGGPLASETCWRRKTSPRAQPGRSICHFVFTQCPLPSLPVNKQKTLLTTRQAGLGNLSLVFLEPAYPQSAQITLGILCQEGNKPPGVAHDTQSRPFVRCRRSDDRLRSERHRVVRAGFHKTSREVIHALRALCN